MHVRGQRTLLEHISTLSSEEQLYIRGELASPNCLSRRGWLQLFDFHILIEMVRAGPGSKLQIGLLGSHCFTLQLPRHEGASAALLFRTPTFLIIIPSISTWTWVFWHQDSAGEDRKKFTMVFFIFGHPDDSWNDSWAIGNSVYTT